MGVTRIQHNLSAMNSMSNYQGNSNALTNNLEKLSSGYRINSAADDAAGLAISEKMRSQIAGLEKAQDNANDGISLVQTAEGALTEVNSMLTRLKSLATQSANGTYEDGVDRANIQEETDALLSEIDRISESTNFNGIKLLDGSLSGKSQVSNLAITESTAISGKFSIGQTDTIGKADQTLDGSAAGKKLSVEDIGKSISYTVTWKDADGNEKTTTAKLTFMGKGDGTVSDLTVADSAKENYFVDDRGTKYYLESQKLSQADIQSGIKAGLENDEEFSSNFMVENSNGKFTFSTKTNGTHTATIVGGASDADFADTALNDNIRANSVAGGETSKVEQYAKDSYQKFNAGTDIKAATSTSDAADIEAKTFEVDGSKFLVVDSSWKADQTKNLDPDINVFQLKGTTFAANDDGDKLAAFIEKQTGRATEFKSTANTTEGIAANDIIFKDAENRLKTQGNELTLQIGDTPEKFQQVGVKIQDMSSKGLGLTGLDLSNQEGAAKAIDTIQNAVNAVSTQRGQLGALQNRLDHTLNSLDATTQNITAAESQIRDVDMAKEMTQYSKNNILVQAAQSMLAQANSLPQGVLSLLQ